MRVTNFMTDAEAALAVRTDNPMFVYIGRRNRSYNLEASKWHNPYRIGTDGTREEVVEKYRQSILNDDYLLRCLPNLRGKTLVCWCAPEMCHGDVLVELVNGSQ